MINQLAIACTGVVAIYLTQSSDAEQRRYACLFGMAGQPFWFYSAYTAEQWGVFGLCILYTISWSKGFYTHWLRKRKG